MSDGSASEGPRRARRGVLELDARGLELVTDRVGGREVLGGPRGGPLLEQGAGGAVDLVTGVTKVAQAGMALTYTLDATPAAGVVAASSTVVTYTITGGT